MNNYDSYKRIFDIFFSLILILFFLPIIILSAFIIKITSRGPIIYFSKRIGKNNQFFKMPKFRSMLLQTPQVATHLLEDPKIHITRVGKILRKLSLDEIPQLFSVLKGDMSIVGPRPALFNQKDLIALRNSLKIHLIIPGITGWAQVNGRDSMSIEKKTELDKYYLLNRSFKLDLLIILLTLVKVLKFSNIKH